MSKTYALVDGGVVINIVTADADWVTSQDVLYIESTDTNRAYIGGGYTASTGLFVLPPESPLIGE